jgi:Tfp pilus tip-associated adhesin PilY1
MPKATQMKTQQTFPFPGLISRLLCCGLASLAMSTLSVQAAQTDLSSSPITSVNGPQAKPNIMLLMDTSGSIGWGHMPDEVETAIGINAVGYKNAQCNILYYNPNQVYALPKKADGTFFAQPVFTSALYDAYNSSSLVSVNLSNAFKAYDSKTLRIAGYNDTPQPAYYYLHTGGVPITSYTAPTCADADTGASKAASDGGTWTRVVVSSSSGPGVTDERLNFAIWYSYYRTRLSLIKSAASLAFNPLTDSFRVGFITMNPKYPNNTVTDSLNAPINAANYVPIADFDTTQRALWFSKLFSQTPGGASPAREGLARVGRHYAGKHDGINTGMTGDPVQYSCQQNFTIMTTDGYWNDQAETPGAGPVMIDGVTPVGDQDGVLTPPSGNSPRPIWEGVPSGQQVTTNKLVAYSYSPCGTYFARTDTQVSATTTQLTSSTSQTTQSTSQMLQGTAQTLQTSLQNLQSTTQTVQSTLQNLQSTRQNLQSTVQNLQSTTQPVALATWIIQTIQINLQSTTQTRKSTVQTVQSTSQTVTGTTQKLQSTTQNLRSTSQVLQSTSQTLRATSQTLTSTSQTTRSTSQTSVSTTQAQQSTTQLLSCSALTELCTPVPAGGCTASTSVTCNTVATGPTLVASCTPAAASAANNYVTTTCLVSNTGPTPTTSCTAASASAANAYTATSCNTVTTSTPVAACTPAAATAGNAYTTTTCSSAGTGPTPSSSCTPQAASSANAYTATTCSTSTSGPTPVDGGACTAVAASSANSWTATTCTVVATTNVPVASCTAAGASSANAYTATTCTPVTTSNVPVQTCSPSSATSSNSYTATTCATNNTSNVAVQTCSASAATSPNWITTTCATNTTANVPTQTCTVVAASSANNWTATTCSTLVVNNTPVQSCTASGPTAANSWTTTTCPAAITTGPTGVQTCANASASAANNWTTTTCASNNTSNVPVASCTAATGNSGNSWTTTTCPAPTIVSTTPNVQSCTASPGTAANGYQQTICTAGNSSTPTATCVASGPTAANGWTTTTCGNTTTGPTAVQTCTPQTGNAGNNFVTITCSQTVTTNVPVQTCTAAAAKASNNWTTTTCPAAIVTTNVPVASCTAAAASNANNWIATTCPAPITTGPTYLATCTPVAASAANSWTATICTPNNTTNVPVASCTPVAAGSGNNWTATSCSTNNSVNAPVQSCTPQTAAAGNGYTTITCASNNTANAPVQTCSPSAASAANNWIGTTCTANNTANVPVASCTPSAATSANGWVTTTCPTLVSGPTGTSSCTATAPNAGNNYLTTTCNMVNSGPTLVASCTNAVASAANSWTTTSCSTSVTGPVAAATCSPAAASAANNYVATTCTASSGNKIQYQTLTAVDATYFSGGIATGTSPTTTTTGPLTDLDGVCYAPNTTPPALPSPNPQPAAWTAADATTYSGCTGWPCTVSSAVTTQGSYNSLADVAQYYYVTDLRPASDWPANISTDNVPSVGTGPEDDRLNTQHMTTFTVSLGVSGTLNYRPDYKSASAITGDFAGIRTGIPAPPPPPGATAWPLWPDPSLDYVNNKDNWNNPKSIDDFWHAAVNGRGQYFSAGNPTSVIAGLNGALSGILARTASAAGAGTSNLEPVAGDNMIYLASYQTQAWNGNVVAKQIDLVSGAVSATANWSAAPLLDARAGAACDARNIYLFRQGAANNLANFTWNTQTCDVTGNPTGASDTGLNAAEQANFGASNISLLSQYPLMTDGTAGTVDQRTPAAGANLVNYLRGERGREGFVSNDATKLYRARVTILGDTVDGSPIYVRAPFALYGDPGYSAFKAANSGRTPMLYVPANDGMLHAFYAGTSATDPLGGKEAWAVIPSTVLPNLYKLADNNYGNNHAFFVDGTPTVSDFYDAASASWKTLLVAGLNDGGKGYYAIDVTDPASPKGMWEFKWNPAVCPASTAAAAGNASDCHLGYSFGHPIVTKLADGTWVVLVTSGYNNVNAPAQAGDGQGYLYVLNASTGRIIYKIGTGVGNATTPSGLAQINNYVEDASASNSTVRVYGTDLLGNIWRFDVNDNTPPVGREATLVGTATDASGTPQPITVRPEITALGTQPMIFVATGRLLGLSDFPAAPAVPQVQSVYGIVDPVVGTTAFPNLRSALAPLAMTQVGSGPTAYRSVACTGTTLQCGSQSGWVVNLPDPAELVNVEMKLRSGTLIVASNVPTTSGCSTGGYGWLNYFEFQSGQAIPGGANTNSVSALVADTFIVGITVIKLPDANHSVKGEIVTGSGAIMPMDLKFKTSGGSNKEVSWREISTQ